MRKTRFVQYKSSSSSSFALESKNVKYLVSICTHQDIYVCINAYCLAPLQLFYDKLIEFWGPRRLLRVRRYVFLLHWAIFPHRDRCKYLAVTARASYESQNKAGVLQWRCLQRQRTQAEVGTKWSLLPNLPTTLQTGNAIHEGHQEKFKSRRDVGRTHANFIVLATRLDVLD